MLALRYHAFHECARNLVFFSSTEEISVDRAADIIKFGFLINGANLQLMMTRQKIIIRDPPLRARPSIIEFVTSTVTRCVRSPSSSPSGSCPFLQQSHKVQVVVVVVVSVERHGFVLSRTSSYAVTTLLMAPCSSMPLNGPVLEKRGEEKSQIRINPWMPAKKP